MGYCLDHKRIGELYVITSPDLPGLYVANPEEAIAAGQVNDAIAAIERINARAKEREQLQQRYT